MFSDCICQGTDSDLDKEVFCDQFDWPRWNFKAMSPGNRGCICRSKVVRVAGSLNWMLGRDVLVVAWSGVFSVGLQ